MHKISAIKSSFKILTYFFWSLKIKFLENVHPLPPLPDNLQDFAKDIAPKTNNHNRYIDPIVGLTTKTSWFADPIALATLVT